MSTESFIKRAACNFMVWHPRMGKSTMKKQLPKALQSKVLKSLSANGEDEHAVDFSVKLFGPHQADFNTYVLAPRAKIRNYLYDNTLVLSQQGTVQKRGPRLVPVARVPAILQQVRHLEQVAADMFEDFCRDYDRFLEAGKRAADAQFRGFANISAHLKWPSLAEFRDMFYMEVGRPQPMADLDMSRFSLPADIADEIFADNAQALASQLEAAKDLAIASAEKYAKRLTKQLRDGERFHESLVTEAEATATMLRDFADGYDNDPRIKALATELAEIAKVKTVEAWKTDPARRAADLARAETVQKGMRDLAKAAKVAPPEQRAADKLAASDIVDGGLLSDIL